MKNKAWTKSFLSSLIAILCGLIFGLLIMFLVIPNQALEGFSILIKRPVKSTSRRATVGCVAKFGCAEARLSIRTSDDIFTTQIDRNKPINII